jgi:7-carboxy-7-deazaguanine synthase
MRIAEIFYSVQGEGMLLGVPSVFIRTGVCNLRCTWCDTPYASWNPDGRERALDDVVTEALGHGARHMVVTGGEPMIEPEAVALTERLRSAGQHITVETAGTVYKPVQCDLMSISPKLTNSTPLERDGGRWAAQHERLRYQPGVLRKLMADYPYQLKFVVARPEDLDEIQAMVGELGADAERVLLMPEGTTNAVLAERSVWLAEVCKQHGFRFSPRLHVLIWGDKRGV